jgi:hypothetical protein
VGTDDGVVVAIEPALEAEILEYDADGQELYRNDNEAAKHFQAINWIDFDAVLPGNSGGGGGGAADEEASAAVGYSHSMVYIVAMAREH